MAGFVMIDVEITDAERYGEFMEKATATVEAYGGKFTVRGGTFDVIEGDWTPNRLALLEFATVEDSRAWLASPEYNALNEIRTSSSNINMVVVEGA